MRTSRPISTISYNSKEFLISTLDRLITFHVISFYSFIFHYAEKDESKDHFHLFIMPDHCIDTSVICNEFVELSEIPDKPFRCMPFRSSKFDDWYLYSIHNKSYLLKKMQSREYHYQHSDILSSDSDFLLELVHHIDFSRLSHIDEIISSVNDGLTFADYALHHYIPVQQFSGYKLMYETLSQGLFRAGRVSHSPSDTDSNAVLASEFVTDVDNPFL